MASLISGILVIQSVNATSIHQMYSNFFDGYEITVYHFSIEAEGLLPDVNITGSHGTDAFL